MCLSNRFLTFFGLFTYLWIFVLSNQGSRRRFRHRFRKQMPRLYCSRRSGRSRREALLKNRVLKLFGSPTFRVISLLSLLRLWWPSLYPSFQLRKFWKGVFWCGWSKVPHRIFWIATLLNQYCWAENPPIGAGNTLSKEWKRFFCPAVFSNYWWFEQVRFRSSSAKSR